MRNKAYSVVIFSITVLVVGVFLFARPLRVSGDCMEPAIKDGQLYFLNNVLPYLQIGDTVAFKYDNKIWVSRIVALENDIIHITDGSVLVNDAPDKVSRNWTHWKNGMYGIDEPFQVPVNHVFVLSDNLAARHDDSRTFGPVPKKMILGVIW